MSEKVCVANGEEIDKPQSGISDKDKVDIACVKLQSDITKQEASEMPDEKQHLSTVDMVKEHRPSEEIPVKKQTMKPSIDPAVPPTAVKLPEEAPVLEFYTKDSSAREGGIIIPEEDSAIKSKVLVVKYRSTKPLSEYCDLTNSATNYPIDKSSSKVEKIISEQDSDSERKDLGNLPIPSKPSLQYHGLNSSTGNAVENNSLNYKRNIYEKVSKSEYKYLNKKSLQLKLLECPGSEISAKDNSVEISSSKSESQISGQDTDLEHKVTSTLDNDNSELKGIPLIKCLPQLKISAPKLLNDLAHKAVAKVLNQFLADGTKFCKDGELEKMRDVEGDIKDYYSANIYQPTVETEAKDSFESLLDSYKSFLHIVEGTADEACIVTVIQRFSARKSSELQVLMGDLSKLRILMYEAHKYKLSTESNSYDKCSFCRIPEEKWHMLMRHLDVSYNNINRTIQATRNVRTDFPTIPAEREEFNIGGNNSRHGTIFQMKFSAMKQFNDFLQILLVTIADVDKILDDMKDIVKDIKTCKTPNCMHFDNFDYFCYIDYITPHCDCLMSAITSVFTEFYKFGCEFNILL